MLRIVATLLVAMFSGLVLGRIQSAVVNGGYEERFRSTRASDAELKGDSQAVQLLSQATGTPKVEVVGGADYDFGVMQHGETQSKEFVFRNVGDGPLSLNMGGSTCKCTVGELDRTVLQPGEETVVKLTWTANTILPDFGQTATIITNDPTKPEVKLTVHGRVAKTFVLSPSELALGTISNSQPMTAKFYFFNYSQQPVKVQDITWSDDATRRFVDFNAQEVPLEAAQFPEHQQATSVHEIVLNIKPGLPVGPLSARVHLHTSMELPSGSIDYRVSGNVIGDVSLIGGASFDPSVNLLKLGTVDSQEGAEVTVFVSLSGAKKEALLSVDSIVPDEALDVVVEPPKEVGDRRVFPVKFIVPKGAPPVYYPANSRGRYGKVILNIESDSPEQVVIFVRLNVRNSDQN
ncbi:MAG: hypothetical protein KatS3mg111_3203 [Pirellulaceae bacterium]|nr:MAG: hypothetical protein KatS3mg111_3203 [Pirellulaceae bacterium]